MSNLNTDEIFANNNDIDAVIADATGPIHVERDGERVELGIGDGIYESDLIITGNSAVDIIFRDGATSRLTQNTEVRLVDFEFAEGEEPSFIMDLVHGSMRTVSGEIVRLNPEAFEVNTPRATVGIRGTEFVVSVGNGQEFFAVLHIGEGHIMLVTTIDGQSVTFSFPMQGLELLPSGEILPTGEITVEQMNAILQAISPILGVVGETEGDIETLEEIINILTNPTTSSSYTNAIEINDDGSFALILTPDDNESDENLTDDNLEDDNIVIRFTPVDRDEVVVEEEEEEIDPVSFSFDGFDADGMVRYIGDFQHYAYENPDTKEIIWSQTDDVPAGYVKISGTYNATDANDSITGGLMDGTTINTLAGDDVVEIASMYNNAQVNLGAGNDMFFLTQETNINGTINGGDGIDFYYDANSAPSATYIGFEVRISGGDDPEDFDLDGISFSGNQIILGDDWTINSASGNITATSDEGITLAIVSGSGYTFG